MVAGKTIHSVHTYDGPTRLVTTEFEGGVFQHFEILRVFARSANVICHWNKINAQTAGFVSGTKRLIVLTIRTHRSGPRHKRLTLITTHPRFILFKTAT